MDDTLAKYDQDEMDAYIDLANCSCEHQILKAMEMASDNRE